MPGRRKFLKQMSIGAAGICLAPAIPQFAWAEINITPRLLRSIPEAQGISSENILAFINSVENKKLGMHSLMLVRHGKVVAEGWWDPYKADLKHMLFSLSKSFTSTAVGFAVAEGKLTVEDKVTSFFPEYLPAKIDANLAAMRVKDLLTMNTGHEKDTMPSMREGHESWVKTFLSLPVEHKPGSFFLYNSGATYMLAAIVQKLSGKTLLDYLKPRLLDPLEIKGADWEISPEGINTAAYGLRITTEDIATFGQFYLQKGVWKGKRLLPQKWIEEATAYQVSNAALTGKDENSDWQQGYGYQFWRCRHDLYRGDGAVGQFCIVMEEHDAVLAITSETANMQAIMNEVWDKILAGLKKDPLPANSKALAALQKKLSTLTLLPSDKITTSPIVATVSGKTFKVEKNDINADMIGLKFDKNTCAFTIHDDKGVHTVLCGLDHWQKSVVQMPGSPPNLVKRNNKASEKAKVAAAGLWKDDKTFEMTLQFYETPHSDTITCHFEKNSLQVEFKNSLVGKMANFFENRPVLKGSLIA